MPTIRTLFVTLAVLAAARASGQVSLEFSGDLPAAGDGTYKEMKVQACNGTPVTKNLQGWRFRTPSFAGWTAFTGADTHTGTGPYQYTHVLPEYDRNLAPGKCLAAPSQYYSKIPVGLDGTPHDPQVLIKTGSCGEPSSLRDAAPIQCGGIAALTADPDYYAASKCVPDTLGTRGADALGSLTASYFGQTQIQAAIPLDTLSIYHWSMKWDPRSLGGPMYMMSLAMAQEYLGMNRQWLQTIAGKETNFAYVSTEFPERGSISEWANGNNNQGGHVWTLWEILTPYLANLIHAYPDYYPKYACANGYPGPNLVDASCVGSWEDAIAFYIRTPGTFKTGTDSPQLANAVFTVSLAYYWIYDAMRNATDLCYADAVDHGKDKRVALAGILPQYADGIYNHYEDPLRDRNLRNDPDVYSKLHASPSPDYRENVFYLLDTFSKANNASQACGGPNPVYDAAISWDEVQRFFFGGSGKPGTPEAQGDGGLLLHFDLSAAQRQGVLADLRCAFDALKGRAPSVKGMDATSYRYDWLTMLRSVKARLPLRRKLPAQTEFNTWVKDRSLNPRTCAGAARDTVFPGLTLLDPVQGAAVPPGFKVSFASEDDVDVTRAEWTLDMRWEEWSPATRTAPGRYAFQVPCDAQGYPRPGGKGRLWIRTGDGCGNSTLQQLDFTADTARSCAPPDIPVTPIDGPKGDPKVIPKDTLKIGPGDSGKTVPKDSVSGAVDQGLDFFVTFPNGSRERPASGSRHPEFPSGIFIPVDAAGTALAGSGHGKCPGCHAGGNGRFAGPVFHILTHAPVAYAFRIFSTSGEFLAEGDGKIETRDLPALAAEATPAGIRYEARIVWTGATALGNRAGTGAYILLARLRGEGAREGNVPPARNIKAVFGLLR